MHKICARECAIKWKHKSELISAYFRHTDCYFVALLSLFVSYMRKSQSRLCCHPCLVVAGNLATAWWREDFFSFSFSFSYRDWAGPAMHGLESVTHLRSVVFIAPLMNVSPATSGMHKSYLPGKRFTVRVNLRLQPRLRQAHGTLCRSETRVSRCNGWL